jgi:hypothetical protein
MAFPGRLDPGCDDGSTHHHRADAFLDHHVPQRQDLEGGRPPGSNRGPSPSGRGWPDRTATAIEQRLGDPSV